MRMISKDHGGLDNATFCGNAHSNLPIKALFNVNNGTYQGSTRSTTTKGASHG